MKKRWIAGVLCLLLVLMSVPMLVAVASTTMPGDSLMDTMAKTQGYIFECKSQEQIKNACGGDFAESSSVSVANVFPVQTGEDGLTLVAGTSHPTIYKPTVFGTSIPEDSAVKLTFRLDTAESDIELVFNSKGAKQRIVFKTEERKINGSAPLTVGTYYDVLLALNEDVVSLYYKEKTATSYIDAGTIPVEEAKAGGVCSISALSGGTAAAGVTLYEMSTWKDVAVAEAEILDKIVLKQNINFSDYYKASNSLDNNIASLKEAKGGSVNFTTAGGPFTSNIDPTTMTFVAKDAGSRTPAVGYSAEGISLNAGSRKTYGSTETPEGTTVGAYTWTESEMGETTINTDLGEVGAYKITFRLANATSKGQFVLEDGTNNAAPNISFSKDGFTVQGCDFWYGEETEGTGLSSIQEESDICVDFPLEAGVWYDVILKNTHQRYHLYAKRSEAEMYKKVVSFVNKDAEVAEKKLVLQAVLGTDTRMVNGDTWYMTTSGFTVKSIGCYLPVGIHQYVEESFAALSGINYVTSGTASVADDMLTLGAGGSFTIKDLMIPVGGYADIKLKMSASSKLRFGDGSKAITINPNTQGESTYIGNGDEQSYGVTHTPDSWVEYRVIKVTADQYMICSRSAGETDWKLVVALATAAKDSSAAGMYLQSVGGTTMVDDISVYGCSAGEPVLVTDGITATGIPEGGTMKYKGNFRILVNVEEDESKKGIVAGYNNKGDLVELEEFAVPTSTGECSYTTTKMTKDGIVAIKVFVWDGYEKMIPATPVYSVNR